jgi:hypothetical protein
MHFVLMGDIVGSSKKNDVELMSAFKAIIRSANDVFVKQIVSPLTITLGDEFQGVVKDLVTVVDIIFHIDQALLAVRHPFRIRYSLQYGPIDTPLNAHAMLGEGLTKARKGLEEMKQKKAHYRLVTTHEDTDDMLNGLFRLYDSFYSDWAEKDFAYLRYFFKKDDYKWVAAQLSKDPSTVWRKRNSLKLDEFNTAKELITATANKFK